MGLKRTRTHLMQILLIAGILSLLTAHVCADTLVLFDKMPKYSNGENSILLQARTGNNYTDLSSLMDAGDYWFGTPSTFRHKPSITRGILPGNNPYDKLAIHAFPSAVIQTGFKADTVIRVTIPGNGKFVKISGQTGFEGKSTISHYRFYIYKGADQYSNPLWESEGGGNFNFNVPYSANDQLFFAVEALDSDDEMAPKWKSVVLETITDQVPAANPVSSNAVNTSQGTQSVQKNKTAPPASGSTTGGGDNFFLYAIAGVLIVLVAIGGFFVMRGRSAPKISSDAPSAASRDAILSSPPPYTPPQVQKDTPPAQMPVQSDSSSSFPSELLSLYQDVKYIGEGGFARIFSAKKKDGISVAIKVPLFMNPTTGKAFISELQNWTRLEHENIVRIYDYNVLPVPYFEMELCDGALVDHKKPIQSEEAVWILFNICEGLKFAHDRKIIHRDLKPQNVLLKNGVPKISDWGLSRIISESTTTSATSFTPYYAAPEQIGNKAKDERTDLWQLGVILYELVTGVLPFQGDSMVEIGMNIATKDPKRPGEIKPDAKVIDAVVMKCLEKDPKKRYQSVLELQKDLALYLRKNYAELLKTSVTVQDYTRSAYYCGDLVMINMLTGDLATSYKYLLDLVHYSKGDVKAEAQELSEQIKMRMDMGVEEIPDELIQKAEIIVHRVSLGFRNKG